MGNYKRKEYHDDGCFPDGSFRIRNDLRGDHVGIELELDVGNEGYTTILQALPDTDDDTERPLTETDGSLTFEGGVEIIFPPIAHSRIMEDGWFFPQAIRELDINVSRYTDYSVSRCGMHLNLNTSDWSGDLLNLVVLGFHQVPKTMLERIGGRRLNDYCMRPTVAEAVEVAREDNITPTQAILEFYEEHGNLVGLYGKRLELRYPQATTNIDTIRANVSFAYFLRDYIKQELEGGRMKVERTPSASVGKREQFGEALLEYIAARPQSQGRDLVLGVFNYASKSRCKAA